MPSRLRDNDWRPTFLLLPPYRQLPGTAIRARNLHVKLDPGVPFLPNQWHPRATRVYGCSCLDLHLLMMVGIDMTYGTP